MDVGYESRRVARYGLVVALVILGALAAPLRAGEPAPGDFPGALAHVLSKHPEVQQAEAALVAAGYGKMAAYAGFLPYAEVEVTRGDGNDDSSLRLGLPLWRGGLNFASLDSAEAGRLAAVADLQRVRLDVALRLVDAYFAAIAAGEQDRLWIRYLDVLAGLHGLIDRRAAGGASPYADVLNIVGRMRQADAQTALNRAQRDAARAQLVSLLGGDIAADPAWPLEAMLLTEEQIGQVAARALEMHPGLQSAKAKIAQEEADLRANRARLSPEVSLRHIRSLDDSTSAGDPVTELAFEFQTDSGFRGYQAYRGSQQRILGARAALDAARRDVASAIAVAQAEHSSAKAQLGYQAQAVRTTEAFVQSSLRQFEAGRKTWVEVLNAQREAHETRLTQVQQYKVMWSANIRLALLGLYWEQLLARRDQAVHAGNSPLVSEGEKQ